MTEFARRIPKFSNAVFVETLRSSNGIKLCSNILENRTLGLGSITDG
jgi:hypothetical protein